MRRFLLACLLLLAAAPAAADDISSPKVTPRLVAETDEIAPGGKVAVALEEVIAPDWHTYWSNPGEAGLPTTIDWTLPAGWKAGPIQWPYPKRLPVGPLMNYGYEGTVWLLTDVTAPADAAPGTVVTLRAHASWLVCQRVCIPGDAALSIPLSVSAVPRRPYATTQETFAAWRARIPAPSPWPVAFHRGAWLDLFVASPSLAAMPLKDAAFFPSAEGVVAGMAPQRLGKADGGIVLRLEPAKDSRSTPALAGALVLTSSDGAVQALAIDARPGAVPAAAFSDASAMGLALSLLFALLGGLILNLMPCVLPILAMKALALTDKAHAGRGYAARQGLSYAAGAILSFAALGLAVVLLRAGGAEIGWGFQLQEPAAVAGFALLVFAVGLNLSGVFELGSGLDAGEGLTRRGGWVGSFFTGVLAVAVAAPCTAPFMAAALGYALTQSAPLALLVFLALGIGFALPFALVGLFPGALRFMPRPGMWMLRFKQALAFPMYGAAVWLVWVLDREAGDSGLAAVLAAMVALAFAAWAWSASRAAARRWRAAGAAFAALGLAAAIAAVAAIAGTGVAPAAARAETAGIPSEAYSEATLARYRAEKRPVFVDATAAWCITCLVNERVALSGEAVHRAFARRHVAYLLADWTNRDPAITALLESHGRSGVPLYLYYAPGATQAQVLPQVLTEGAVLSALDR
ncbi:MAG TPA: protein-disulfide reductase DsbD domain-containing protein [Rhizomicrobium sp.]|nr:protein-disulfide reductase DsbD domain-containing protein [Rhizomicrobium sp.]